MLERLLDASGDRLDLGVTIRRTPPTIAALRRYKRAIEDVVSEFGATNVRVFGSVARADATDDPDVDLLIDVPSGTGLVTVQRITDAIEVVIPWHVDVVTSGGARGRMGHILDEAVAL